MIQPTRHRNLLRLGKACERALMLAFVLVIAGKVFADNKVRVGKAWAASQRHSIDRISHEDWSKLLQKYVDQNGMVDYTAWKASSDDRMSLDGYLESLSRADLNAKALLNNELAFWINAYNAVTIRGIIREYPTTSIRNHTPVVYGYHIWKDLLLIVGDKEFSLTQIEHDILRKMSEPRIHFAIVCASVGCPRLRAEAYRADQLEKQLSENAAQFFREEQHLRIDPKGKTIDVSPILKWFATDFGKNQQEQLKFLAPYFPDEAGRSLALDPSVRVRLLPYDWRLNDQKVHR